MIKNFTLLLFLLLNINNIKAYRFEYFGELPKLLVIVKESGKKWPARCIGTKKVPISSYDAGYLTDNCKNRTVHRLHYSKKKNVAEMKPVVGEWNHKKIKWKNLDFYIFDNTNRFPAFVGVVKNFPRDGKIGFRLTRKHVGFNKKFNQPVYTYDIKCTCNIERY